MSDKGIVVSLQNGIGHAQHIASVIGAERTLGGSTTHGAWREDTCNSVHWVGKGKVVIGSLEGGPPNKSASELIRVLEQASLSPAWTNEIEKVVWEKLLMNIAINPICGILGKLFF